MDESKPPEIGIYQSMVFSLKVENPDTELRPNDRLY